MLQLNRPVEVNGQRAAALRMTDLRVLALWHLVVWFRYKHLSEIERKLAPLVQRTVGSRLHCQMHR